MSLEGKNLVAVAFVLAVVVVNLIVIGLAKEDRVVVPEEAAMEIYYATVDTVLPHRVIEEWVISLDGGETWMIVDRSGQVTNSGYLHRKYRNHDQLSIHINRRQHCYDISN
jgi:hypothetical protein